MHTLRISDYKVNVDATSETLRVSLLLAGVSPMMFPSVVSEKALYLSLE
jgi:hypothetical protein